MYTNVVKQIKMNYSNRLPKVILKQSLKSNFVAEILLSLLAGFSAVTFFVIKSGWRSIDLTKPLMYFADPLYYANLVFNAQNGIALKGPSLGGLVGQQYYLSAYGFEWIQSTFVSLFAGPGQGPWLAMNRFLIYSFFATGVVGYVAFRLLEINRLYSTLGAVAFSLIPDHQPFSVGLANMSVLPLSIVIIWKISEGKSLEEVFPYVSKKVQSARVRKRLSIFILFVLALFELTAASYYILLLLLLSSSLALFFLTSPRYLSRTKNLSIFAITKVSVLIISLGPILFLRWHQNLGLAEPSTGDRRPFAAYANGGDLISLISPFSSRSYFSNLIDKISVFKNFYAEYGSSSITSGTEYIIHPFGFVIIFLIVIFLGNYIYSNYRQQTDGNNSTNFPGSTTSVLLLCVSILWYVRGGLGTLTAFIFPYIRGYSRFNAIITFIALLTIGKMLIASSPKKKILIYLSITIVLLDTVSSIPRIVTDQKSTFQKVIGRDEIPGSSATTDNIPLNSLSYSQTEKLISFANKSLLKNCLVMELPIIKFPVDFSIGIPSYYSYELIKPGLTETNQVWSAGGIAGTPGNLSNELTGLSYSKSDLASVISLYESQKVCGVLVFSSIADAISVASSHLGFNYPNRSTISGVLTKSYGKPCYVDSAADVELYCVVKPGR